MLFVSGVTALDFCFFFFPVVLLGRAFVSKTNLVPKRKDRFTIFGKYRLLTGALPRFFLRKLLLPPGTVDFEAKSSTSFFLIDPHNILMSTKHIGSSIEKLEDNYDIFHISRFTDKNRRIRLATEKMDSFSFTTKHQETIIPQY